MAEKVLIKNGRVVTLGEENQIIEDGAVLIADGVIEAVGAAADVVGKADGATVVDAHGGTIMPGFINAHMHMYSTFARGICPKQPPATNFVEVLERLWFPLDKALNEKDLKYSAIVPYIECIRNGTTTMIDHHEGQSCQPGSLDVLNDAAYEMGVRTVLCLGASDRYGKGKEGVDENVRFIKKMKESGKDGELTSAMMAFHAMFTVNEETMQYAADAAAELGVGFHVHVSEAESDQIFNIEKYGKSPVQRLAECGALGPQSIMVHGVHVSEEDMQLLADHDTPLVNNPQSNMNNAVGITNLAGMMEKGVLCGLGTDGMSSNMREEVRIALVAQRLRSQDPSAFFVEACDMLLKHNSQIASRHFNRPVGVLAAGAMGDVIVINYDAPTPLDGNTFLGHFLFGLCGSEVATTIVNGRILMQDRKLIGVNEKQLMEESRAQAADFWRRF